MRAHFTALFGMPNQARCGWRAWRSCRVAHHGTPARAGPRSNTAQEQLRPVTLCRGAPCECTPRRNHAALHQVRCGWRARRRSLGARCEKRARWALRRCRAGVACRRTPQRSRWRRSQRSRTCASRPLPAPSRAATRWSAAAARCGIGMFALSITPWCLAFMAHSPNRSFVGLTIACKRRPGLP